MKPARSLHHWLRPAVMLRLLVLPLTVLAAPTTSSSEHPTDASPDPVSATRTTVDFSSALQIEASVVAQVHQIDRAAAVIPTPASEAVKNVSEYQAVQRLAPAWPPVQAGVGLPESEIMLAHYLAAKKNNTENSLSPVRVGAGSLLGRRGDKIKVMVAGDSMTQGLEGDWTWRYRLWQWFQKNKISMEFVGPHTGTEPPPKAEQPQPPPLYGTVIPPAPYPDGGGYAKGVDAGFLSNSKHFAIWGRAAAVSKGLVKDAMEPDPADLMLIMLGFNDMGWFYSDAYGTIDSIATLIGNARSVNPKCKFAVATVPQRTYIQGREDLIRNTNIYNNLLPSSIDSWTTSESPIYLVDLASHYDCEPAGCPAGYDGLHPNAWGEYLIANAFTTTLVKDLKLGSAPLDVPDRDDSSLVRDLPAPSNFRVFSSPQGVTATWDPVYGAHSYDIKVTINGGANAFSATSSQTNRWDSQWSIDGWDYAISVRASAGNTIKGPYTAVKDAKAKPQLAPPPDAITVQATDSGVTVSWEPPKGLYSDSILEYNVLYWDWASDHCQYIMGAAFKSSPAVITDLTPGVNYIVAVVTWNKNGQGFPYLANNVVPGSGTPPVPSKVGVVSEDATTVRITWTGSDSAGGYHVWNRNVNDLGSKLHVIANVSEGTCNEQLFLFPGAWNYAFAVSAYNGDEESEVGQEMLAPTTTSKSETGCPPKQVWCPDGGAVSVPAGSPTPTGTHGIGSQPKNTSIPFVVDGYCTGPDCKDGQCQDIYCASMGCTGDDCHHGHCRGLHCTPLGCIGAHCRDGVCVGEHCITKGCIGPGCHPSEGRCYDRHCIAIGCIGGNCGGNGICYGTDCAERTCTGTNCVNGVCVGSGCQPGDDDGDDPDGDDDDGDDGDPDDESCDDDLSPETGLCPNGNFPLYDPSANTINCDIPDEEIPFYMSECQAEADEDVEQSQDEIECENQSCSIPSSKRDLSSTRTTAGRYLIDGNLTSNAFDLFNITRTKRQQPPNKKSCPAPQATSGPGAAHPGRKGCDRVFQCDTDLWPNVCNNAAYAQNVRGKEKILTYMGPGARQGYVTQQWWRTHAKIGNVQEHDPEINRQREAGTLKHQPAGGWGLIGCEVEEYPFGNSLSPVPQNLRGIYEKRAVLRLIPWEENRAHGQALAKFIRDAIKGDLPRGLKGLSKDGGWKYCVDITGSQLDEDEYLLGDDQSKNRCGQAYGPGFLLMNDVSAGEFRQYPLERRWDNWFDRNGQLFEHTVYSSGTTITRSMLPSQYGKFPAPGMKTWVASLNTWTTKAPGKPAVGTAVPAGVPGKKGQNLKWDTPGARHQGLRRTIDNGDLDPDPRTLDHPAAATAPPLVDAVPTAGPLAKLTNTFLGERSERLQKRLDLGKGSFVDVDVYRKALGCEAPWEDPCEVDDCFDGGSVYDKDGGPAKDGSADQSGPNGEDTGDDSGGDNGGDTGDGGGDGGDGGHDGGGSGSGGNGGGGGSGDQKHHDDATCNATVPGNRGSCGNDGDCEVFRPDCEKASFSSPVCRRYQPPTGDISCCTCSTAGGGGGAGGEGTGHKPPGINSVGPVPA